jgi:preprotein translocase subunit SecG
LPLQVESRSASPNSGEPKMNNVLLNILLVVQIASAVVMVGLILVQHGKGADMGAAFGGGSSGSLFGASGSANFLSRATAVLAAVFFIATLLMALLSNVRPTGSDSVLDRAPLSAPAPLPGASGAAGQIPGTGTPAAAPAPASSAAAPAAPATPASGAAQIPTK